MDLGDELEKISYEVQTTEQSTQVNCLPKLQDEPANDAQSENASSSMVLLHEIEEFIHKMQLSTEEVILRQIYPGFFLKTIREKFLAQC